MQAVVQSGISRPGGLTHGPARRKNFKVSHSINDAISLELARRVVARLRQNPELLRIAGENLERWSARNADSPSLLRCYGEWQEVLKRPLDEICQVLCVETQEGQRLRQNSPFAGVPSPREVWQIKAAIGHPAIFTARSPGSANGVAFAFLTRACLHRL